MEWRVQEPTPTTNLHFLSPSPEPVMISLKPLSYQATIWKLLILNWPQMVSISKLQQGYTMLSEGQDTKHIVITLSKVASKLTS